MTCRYCGRNECSTADAQPKTDTDIPPVGYRPQHNSSRWSWISEEVNRDKISNPTCIEVGSNYGYMSLKFAQTILNSRIFSIEGAFGTGNSGSTERKKATEVVETEGIKEHLRIRDEFSLRNNIISVGVADSRLLKRMLASETLFDYQIGLSVFHWIVDASSGQAKDDRAILADYLSIARTTFIELPAMTQGRPLPNIYRNYATIPEAIASACAAYDIRIRITYLGSSDWYGTRDTYRIDNLSFPAVKRYDTCQKIVGRFGMRTL